MYHRRQLPDWDIPVITEVQQCTVSSLAIESAGCRHPSRTIVDAVVFCTLRTSAFSALGRSTATDDGRRTARAKNPPLSCRIRTYPSAPRFEARTVDEAPAETNKTRPRQHRAYFCTHPIADSTAEKTLLPWLLATRYSSTGVDCTTEFSRGFQCTTQCCWSIIRHCCQNVFVVLVECLPTLAPA